MPLHFTPEEFAGRIDRARQALAEAGLDALLCFKQETMYWLTGYDTFGFCFFQCLVLRADGDIALLTRSADLRQAQLTSTIRDIRIWVDRDGADPATQLRDLLEAKGLRGKRLGVEYETHGLTAANGRRLDAALDDFAATGDASLLVSRLRLVKSPAELTHIRRAAELADAALDAAVAETRPGADEGRILARMHDASFEGGGDYPGNPFIIGSGPQALLCRFYAGRRRLDPVDQLTLEFAGVHRQYHACLMRTLLVGEAADAHRRMHAACVEALQAAETALRPGAAMGGVRRPGGGARPPRHAGASAERHRLQPGCGLRAVVDGLADVLRRQSGRDRPGHGVLPAHDPDGQPVGPGDDARPHLAGHGRCGRAAVAGIPGPRPA